MHSHVEQIEKKQGASKGTIVGLILATKDNGYCTTLMR